MERYGKYVIRMYGKKEEEENHYVYLIKNIKTGQFYYGIRSCMGDCEKDTEYMGSGSRIQYEMHKHGKEIFEKRIVYKGKTREEVSKIEEMIVDENLLKNPLCLNQKYGGETNMKMKEKRIFITNGYENKKVTLPQFIKIYYPLGWVRGKI